MAIMKIRTLAWPLALVCVAAPGCARVAVEGGDKPIHIVMDVNLRVAKELDDAFSFQEKPVTPPVPPSSRAAAAKVSQYSE